MHQRRDLDLYVAARVLIDEVLRQRCGGLDALDETAGGPRPGRRQGRGPSTLTVVNCTRSSNPNVSGVVSDPACHFVACVCMFGIACGLFAGSAEEVRELAHGN
jgi:hypothetical protein